MAAAAWSFAKSTTPPPGRGNACTRQYTFLTTCIYHGWIGWWTVAKVFGLVRLKYLESVLLILARKSFLSLFWLLVCDQGIATSLCMDLCRQSSRVARSWGLGASPLCVLLPSLLTRSDQKKKALSLLAGQLVLVDMYSLSPSTLHTGAQHTRQASMSDGWASGGGGGGGADVADGILKQATGLLLMIKEGLTDLSDLTNAINAIKQARALLSAKPASTGQPAGTEGGAASAAAAAAAAEAAAAATKKELEELQEKYSELKEEKSLLKGKLQKLEDQEEERKQTLVKKDKEMASLQALLANRLHFPPPHTTGGTLLPLLAAPRKIADAKKEYFYSQDLKRKRAPMSLPDKNTSAAAAGAAAAAAGAAAGAGAAAAATARAESRVPLPPPEGGKETHSGAAVSVLIEGGTGGTSWISGAKGSVEARLEEEGKDKGKGGGGGGEEEEEGLVSIGARVNSAEAAASNSTFSPGEGRNLPPRPAAASAGAAVAAAAAKPTGSSAASVASVASTAGEEEEDNSVAMEDPSTSSASSVSSRSARKQRPAKRARRPPPPPSSPSPFTQAQEDMILMLADQLYRAIPGSYRPTIAACLRVIWSQSSVSVTSLKELEEATSLKELEKAIRNLPEDVLEVFAYKLVGRKHHKGCMENIFDYFLNGRAAAAAAAEAAAGGGGGEGAPPVEVGGRRPNACPPKVLDTEGQIYAKAVQLGLKMGEETFRTTMGEFVLATATEGGMEGGEEGGVKLRSAEELAKRLGKAAARMAAVTYYNELTDNPKKGIVKKIIEAVGVDPRFLKVRLGRKGAERRRVR